MEIVVDAHDEEERAMGWYSYLEETLDFPFLTHCINERAISPFTVHIGFKSDLDLPAFLAQAELKPLSIERINIPRIWSLVTCIKA